ncbi:MAG: hypothetical protein KIS78_00130 [Labilithrix sp.]|nr:hypothetical protein [Labilithrix sp.]
MTAEVSARHRLGDVDGFEVQHGDLEIRRQHEQGEELGDPARVSLSLRATTALSATGMPCTKGRPSADDRRSASGRDDVGDDSEVGRAST